MRFLLTFAFSGMLMPMLQAQVRSRQAQETFDLMTQVFTIDDAKYSNELKWVEMVFSRISSAQERLLSQRASAFNRVHIVENNWENAFVTTTQASRIQENEVYITTAMLEKLFYDEHKGTPKERSLSDSMKEAEIRLAALLGHELRHPATPFNTGQNIDIRKGSSSFLEFDADLGGAVLAEEAGYPRDSGSRLRQVFRPDTDRDYRMASSLLGTHPDDIARDGALRVFQSIRRHVRGEARPTYPNEVPRGIYKFAAAARSKPVKEIPKQKRYSESYARDRNSFDVAAYKEMFRAALRSIDLEKTDADALLKLSQSCTYKKQPFFDESFLYHLELLAERIDELEISTERKKLLAQKFFPTYDSFLFGWEGRPADSDRHWHKSEIDTSDEVNARRETLLSKLKSWGLFPKGIREKLVQSQAVLFKSSSHHMTSSDVTAARYFRLLSSHEKTLEAELASLEGNPKQIKSFIDDILNPFENPLRMVGRLSYSKNVRGGAPQRDRSGRMYFAGRHDESDIAEIRSPKMERLRGLAALSAHRAFRPTDSERIKLFENLTKYGPIDEADRLISPLIEEWLTKPLTLQSKNVLERILETDRLRNISLKARMAERLIFAEINNKRNSRDMAMASLLRIQKWLPEPSEAKDALLEKIAFATHLRGDDLKSLEYLKSTNWNAIKASHARVGSVIAVFSDKMSLANREKLIRYILQGGKVDFPDEIYAEMREIVKDDAGFFARHIGPQATVDDYIKKWLSLAVRDATDMQRLPILEAFLHNGEAALIVDESKIEHLAREYLRFSPNSVEEKLLKIFLRNLPPDERATHLAFLMNKSRTEKMDIAGIYEAAGPVGIRFAQMVARWDLFGPEHSKKIAHLRSKAKAMSLAEIDEALAKRPLINGQIAKIIEVRGCGTNRCAVKVKLHNGDFAMLMIRQPHAPNLISSNLNLARAVLRDARAENLTPDLDLVDFLADDLHDQMLGELDAREEVRKIAKAQELYKELNQSTKLPEGWSFHVPGPLEGIPVYEEMFLMEYFDGEDANPSLLKKFGSGIVESVQRARLSHGVGDVDRHLGNYSFDQTKKQIGVLDTAGWWYEFNPLELAQWRGFLLSLQSRNAEKILLATEPLLKEKVAPEQRDALLRDLQRVVEHVNGGSDLKSIAIDLTRSFELRGLRFQTKFKFGGIMELITLYGEKYVEADEFGRVFLKSFMAPVSCRAALD